jgi:biotin operon repressor
MPVLIFLFIFADINQPMARKKVSAEDMEQIKTMLQEGIKPEEIAEKFGVTVASVNNYKKKFRDAGMSFGSGSKRGRKAKTAAVSEDGETNAPAPIGQIGRSKASTNANAQAYRFIINGVSVEISGQARNINIGKNSMEINF